jgi:hypothetical protein
MRKILVLVFGLSVACGQAHAQPPEILWVTHMDTLQGCAINDVRQTADGNLVACGGFGSSEENVVLVRLDAGGPPIWTRTWPGLGSANRVFEMPDGGFLIAGSFTREPDNWFSQTFGMLRTDANGDSLWTRLYGDTNHLAIVSDVLALPDGEYFFAGMREHIDSTGYIRWRPYCMRLDSNLDTLWTRTYYITNYLYGVSPAHGADENFVIGLWEYGNPWPTPMVLGIASFGDSLWLRHYPWVNGDSPPAVTIRAHGDGYVMCGTYAWYMENSYLTGLDATGDTLWYHQVMLPSDSSAGFSAGDFQILPDGGYVLSGRFRIWNTHSDNPFMVRVNSLGDTLWTKNCGTQAELQGIGRIAVTDDYGYVFPVAALEGDQMVASVWRLGPDPTLAATNTPTALPERLELSAYPNPFNATTTITFSLPTAGAVELRVYDVTGRLVKTLADEKMGAGTHRMTVDGTGLASGVYLARLTTTEQSVTQKLLLIK